MTGAPVEETVLIVVPTLNEAGNVEAVVQSLLNGTGGHSARLVVVDGGSTDGTQQIVRKLASDDRRVRLLDNPARLQSAGVNLAVRKYADGVAYLLRADAHADYPDGFCRELVSEAERTGAASVAVPMLTCGAGGFQTGVAAAQNSVLGTGGSAHRTSGGGRFVDHGHHALMRLDAFREVGGYDERFSHNEDAELDCRLARAGHAIWLTDRVTIGYIPRRDPVSLFRQYWNHGYGRASTLLKHRLKPRLRQLLPMAVPVAMVLAVAGAILTLAGRTTAGALLLVPIGLWAGISLAFGLVLALRARNAAVAWSGPAAMIMHLGWSLGFLSRLLGARR